MAALTKEAILAKVEERRQETHPIEVPEWGGTILVRRMSAEDVEASGLADGKRDASTFARVIAGSAVDESGAQLFTTDDVDALQQIDMMTAARVFGEIMKLNGLMDEDLDEAVASFEQAQHDGSSSD